MANKNNFYFEDLEESDIQNLRPYLKCELSCFYEFLAIQDNMQPAEWFYKYKDE